MMPYICEQIYSTFFSQSDPSLYEQLVVNGTERFKGIADALIESRGKPTADLMEEITIIAQEMYDRFCLFICRYNIFKSH